MLIKSANKYPDSILDAYLSYCYEMFKANPDLIAFKTGFQFSERAEKIKLAESLANQYRCAIN
jgi:hypothetical protein